MAQNTAKDFGRHSFALTLLHQSKASTYPQSLIASAPILLGRVQIRHPKVFPIEQNVNGRSSFKLFSLFEGDN